MEANELVEIINAVKGKDNFVNTLIITLVPVVITLFVNVMMDSKRTKKEFIKKYRIEQLKELYLPLYSMIAQSEYIRKFVDTSYEDSPYIEISKTKRTVETINSKGYKKETYEIENGLSDFSEKAFVNLVIEKSNYASPKLIKMAVAYRFLIENRNVTNKDFKEKYELEYPIIVTQYIKLLTKETNEYLKYCNMEYNWKEKNGSYVKF